MISSMKIGVLVFLVAAVCFPAPGFSRERPPTLFHSAPLIPWAKSVGENRFRSPRNYDDTLLYYRKVLRGSWKVSWKKIINVPSVRAQHIKNEKKDGRWEGLNIYEDKGATYIFVVFTDKELARQAEKASRKRKKGVKARSKSGSTK